MTEYFDEARLDDEAVLHRADTLLRPLAEAGARVRREAVLAAEAVEAAAQLNRDDRPRAVIAAGPDSRLLRAVLEPWCPVPFVAWPSAGLPGWAGAMDLVVVLAPEGSDPGSAGAVAEAERRGSRVVIACPPGSLVAEHAAGRDTTVLPSTSRDQLATAVVMLQLLSRIALGPETDAEAVAVALDEVAVDCSPFRDLATNPAKMLAIALAESTPLLWGGSVLSARAARRIAESVRRASGRAALAGDAAHLLPVIGSTPVPDVFDDPFSDPADGPAPPRPALVVLEDGTEEALAREHRGRLITEAKEHRVRVETMAASASAMARCELAGYASLLGHGQYVAAYLGIGLGRVAG